jgi:general secretion pathway protein G
MNRAGASRHKRAGKVAESAVENAAGHSRSGMAGAGFTLVELVVSITVIVLLMTAFLTRLLVYQREVERLAVDQVVRALRSGLQIQLASMNSRGRMNELPGLLEQNPIDWLAQKPANYLGAFYHPGETELEAGNWYFDKMDHKLVYLYKHSDNSESAEPNQLNFKVKLVNNRENAARNAFGQQGPDMFNSAMVEQMMQ